MTMESSQLTPVVYRSIVEAHCGRTLFLCYFNGGVITKIASIFSWVVEHDSLFLRTMEISIKRSE